VKQLGEDPRRWLMIGFAFLATLVNYLDRQALSVAAPMLREQFDMSNVDYSRVVFAFMLAYTIMNGASGPLVDRLGTRLGYALCVGWWSLAAVLHALATGPLSLGIYRFLLGLGEAGNWPAAVKVVAEWFPARERALASGIFNSGSAVGAILAPPLVAAVILGFGWRWAFIAVGMTGFVWVAAWWFIYSTPESDRTETAERVPFKRLVADPFVRIFTSAKVFLDPAWYFYIFWFPEYLKSARGFDLASIGKYAWIPFMVAGAGNILGGWLSAFFMRAGASVLAARLWSVTFFALLMAAAIPAVLVREVHYSIALVSLAMVGYTGTSANLLAMPADNFPKTSVASVYGLASMGSGFGGMVFSLITGWLVDHYSYVPVFVGFGVLPLVSAAILWNLRRLPARTPAPASAGTSS
jgi:ACS family hexuronate transporter-like MFS transporter